MSKRATGRTLELLDAQGAFRDGTAYHREIQIRRLLRDAGIATDQLTGLVLLSIAADQLEDHPRELLLGNFSGMMDVATTGHAEGMLCPNERCRTARGMSQAIDGGFLAGPGSYACMFCGTAFPEDHVDVVGTVVNPLALPPGRGRKP